MMRNIDRALYAKFKLTGYRIGKNTKYPVTSTPALVELAYRDVCRTMHGIVPEQGQSFKQVAVSLIERLLTAPPTSQREFDLLHHQSCQLALEFSAPNAAHIHYGQSQKLLNMSLKYLYNEFEFYQDVQDAFGFPDNIEDFFHLPVDRQTREFLVRRCNFQDPTKLPWSKWGCDHYLSFQAEVRNRFKSKYLPLEIDYMIWNTEGATLNHALMLNL